jgi:acetate kinase
VESVDDGIAAMTGLVLVLNAGSSSIKFAIYEDRAHDFVETCRGQIEGIGTAPRFRVKDASGAVVADQRWPDDQPLDREQALVQLLMWIREHLGGHEVIGVGHRVVHGGQHFAAPVRVDESILEALEALAPLAPLHQPHNLLPIRLLLKHRPGLPQVACFDTAFHRTMPELAQLYALPRAIIDRGVRRYGFHGLSYEYIASVLPQAAPGIASGRVIVAHLGSGASLCALQGGRSIATTLGFSALEGLPMGTRSGSLDPGAVFFLMRDMKLTPDEAENLLYNNSGLLGVSGVSNDMRILKEQAATNPHCREAIDLFCYRIGREIGSLVAALGGIDGLVFTAGIGENDAELRASVLHGAAWAGFTIDEPANAKGGPFISGTRGPAAYVLPTNEELMIARHTRQVLAP